MRWGPILPVLGLLLLGAAPALAEPARSAPGCSTCWRGRDYRQGSLRVSFIRDLAEAPGPRPRDRRELLEPRPGAPASPVLIVAGDPDYLEAACAAHGALPKGPSFSQDPEEGARDLAIRHRDYELWHDVPHRSTHYHALRGARTVTPLVLDLGGSGQLGASRGQWRAHPDFDDSRVALFDFWGTGQEVLTEWVGPSDGLLCVPKPDGSVDGTCLFGSAEGFGDGFQQLALRDADGDGVVSGPELAGLQVWLDRNGNGLAGPTELIPVQDLEITALHLAHEDSRGTYDAAGRSWKLWDWHPTVYRLKRVDPDA